MTSIAVYCGSSSGASPAYRAAAVAVGEAVAAVGSTLVYGGGHVGLMGAVADAALTAGGSVTGVMTEQLVALEVQHEGLTELEVLPNMHARKARMAALANGVVVLPGGFGTYEEAFEVLTWNQLGLVSMPVVFLDVVVDGKSFFGPLFDFVSGAARAGFMKVDHAALVQRTDSAVDAVALASAPAPVFTRKWVDPL